MVWIAALYFVASPNAGSGETLFWLSVSQPPRSSTASGAAMSSLEDMAIFLFEAGGLSLGGAARKRHGRVLRAPERGDCGRHAGVGAAVEEQVRFVGRTDAVGRRLEAAGSHRPYQPLSDDDHQLRLFALKAG